MTELLNELRAEAGETPVLRKNVLRDARKAREKLGEIGRLNFEPATYSDAQGKSRKMLRFSDAVLLNVVAAVGGAVEHQLLYRANVELNRLKEMERSGDLAPRGDNAAVVAVLDRMDQRADERHREAALPYSAATASPLLYGSLEMVEWLTL